MILIDPEGLGAPVMSSRRYVAALDRSSRGGLEVYGIIVARADSQGSLIRYSDFFKHLRRLGSRKRMYIPKMLRIVDQLVENNVIIGLRVFTKLDSVLEAVYRRRASILACIVDNNIYNYYTTTGTRANNYFRGIPLVLLESILREPSRNIIKSVQEAGLTMTFLRIVVKISDNIANYARNMLESQLQNLPQVWKL